MHRKKLLPILFASLSLGSLAASGLQAQTVADNPHPKNEVGLVIGATLTSPVSQTNGPGLSHDAGFTLGAEYDRVLISRKFEVSGGVSFYASPNDVKLSGQAANVTPQYAFLFLAPYVRVKYHADKFLSPWLLFGGGYTRFREAAPTASVGFTQGSNTGTLEFGAGVDTKPLLKLPIVHIPLGARFEVIDFLSGTPNYNVNTSSFQNNVVLTAGPVLRF